MLKNQPLSISLPESTVNIEEKSRSNLFTWRGQFSPQLVEALLIAYAKDGDKVFDPFLGSGTVLYESGLLGLQAFGCEINPAAISFAKVYELICSPMSERRSALSSIDALVTQHTKDLPLLSTQEPSGLENDLISRFSTCENNTTKIVLNAFIVGLDLGAKKTDAKRIISVWNTLRSTIEKLPTSSKELKCFEADARKSPLNNNSINIVITSPPYINVFNYHQNYRQSVEMLGVDVLGVARSEIGSNRKFRGNRFLTVIQYCMDMAQVVEELKRVCTFDAKIIFIVGKESNVKKTPFYNADLLARVAIQCGLNLEGSQTRVFTNKFGASIYEEILRFSIQNKEPRIDAVEIAKDVGVEGLASALESASTDVILEIRDAIRKAAEIQPSNLLGEQQCYSQPRTSTN